MSRGVQGLRGVPGEKGATGEAGPRGRKGRFPFRVTAAFVAVTLVSFVVLSFFGYQIHKNQVVAAQGKEAHDAICTLKRDLIRRVQASEAFLKTHPDGIPGINAKVMQNGIDGQLKTVHALRKVKCRPPVMPPQRS